MAGAALVAGLGLAVKQAGDVQLAVARISTIAPDIDVSKVSKSLGDISTRVAQTQTQLAASLNNIFSSMDVGQSEALQLTEQFAKGAVAAGSDAETFGTAVLGVLNAYKLSAGDATHISDVFFNTIKTGVISGDQLAKGLGQVTQQAKLAGVNIDTLGALIAGVTREGGDASVNLNNLANLLAKITTADAQAGLQAIGIATKDASGNFRDIVSVLEELRTKLAGLSEGDRAKALQSIFPDVQARTGLTVLLSQLDTVKGALLDNQNAAGVAETAYGKISDTAANTAAILKNQLNAALVDLGNQALPGLVDGAKRITDIIKAFNDLPEAQQGAIVKFAEISAAILLLGSGASKAITAITGIAGALRTLTAAAGGGAALLKLLGEIGIAVGVADFAIKSISGDRTNLKDLATSLLTYGDALAKGREDAQKFFDANKGNTQALNDQETALKAQLKVLQDRNAEMEKFSVAALLDLINARGDGQVARNIDINNIIKEIELIQQLRAAQEDLANRQHQARDMTGFVGPVAPFTGPILPPGAAKEAGDLATGLEAVNLSAVKGRDSLLQVSDATATLLTRFHETDAQAFARQLTEVGASMSAVSSATAPLSAALDQINAKRAAGLPLTAQENSLLSQIPGYLGAATQATSALVEKQALLAINSINAQGGINALAGTAGSASGAISALDGAIQALQSHMSALGTENGKLAGDINLLQERVDVLNKVEADGGKLSAQEAAEKRKLTDVIATLSQRRGDNAAKIREETVAYYSLADAQKATASVELSAANAAKGITGAFKPTITAADLAAQAAREFSAQAVTVAVPIDPVVEAGRLAAMRALLGAPVSVPVKIDLQGLGGGAVKGALGIAESMGLSTSGITQAITVTANTSAAETAISTVQQHLLAINNTPTLATINAVDNASGPALAVAVNVKAIPEIHATELNVVDNATQTVLNLIDVINSIPPVNIAAHVDTSAAIQAINDLRAYMPSSPSEKGAFRTLPDWSSVFLSLAPAGEDAVLSIEDTTQRMAESIGAGIDDATAAAAKSAAELATTVAGAVNATTDALGKLRSFRAPNPAQFLKLRDALIPVIDLFAQDAIARGDGTKAAADYAEQLGKIVAAVGVGVDTLGKLRNFQRPSDQAVSDFRDASQYLVNVILQVAHDTDTDLTAAGATYAEAAGKMYSSVGTGVDALTKLQRFKRPTDKAVTDFRDVSQFLVNVMAQVAADIEDQALPKAGDWADAASKIFGAVSSGVDALGKLDQFQRPTDQAVNSFRDVSQYAVNLIAQVAADIEDQALPKATAWADTALKIFQAIGSGVDGLSKLEGFERPTDQALRSFRDVTQLAVTLIAQAAASIGDDALTDAGTYADAASKVVGLIGQGVDSFAKLATGDLQLPDRSRLDAFAAKTAEAVTALAAAAATVDTRAVQAAGTYADGAGKTVALVGQGVEGFSKLATFTAPTAAQIRLFAAAVSATVIAIAEASKSINADAVKSAGEYSDGASKAVGLLGTAVGAFKSMGDKDFVLPSKEGIDSVVYLAQYATDRLIGISHSYGNGDLHQLKAFADAASSGFGAIRGALDAGKSLADPDRIKPADAIGAVLSEFQAGLAPLGALATLSQQYKTQGELIGANIAQAYAAIAAGLPGFTAQSQAATASVSVTSGQTITHHFDGAIDIKFLGNNGAWVVSSLRVDDAALTATSDLIAGKLLPIFEAAVGAN